MSICKILCQYFMTYHSDVTFCYKDNNYKLDELLATDGFLPRMIHCVEGNYKYVFNRKPAVNFVRKEDALCSEQVFFADDEAQSLILVMYLIDLVERWIDDEKICQNKKLQLDLV